VLTLNNTRANSTMVRTITTLSAIGVVLAAPAAVQAAPPSLKASTNLEPTAAGQTPPVPSSIERRVQRWRRSARLPRPPARRARRGGVQAAKFVYSHCEYYQQNWFRTCVYPDDGTFNPEAPSAPAGSTTLRVFQYWKPYYGYVTWARSTCFNYDTACLVTYY
jgi:hypothetical protein